MNRLVLALLLCSAGASQAAPPAYKIGKTVSLGLPDRWDDLLFDAASDHVLIAHGTHTDVVDGKSGAVLGRLEGLQGAHGEAVARSGTIFADSGKTGTLTAFDSVTMKMLRTVQVSVGADAVIQEPAHDLVVVLDGKAESATLVDAAGKHDPVVVPLGGAPEYKPDSVKLLFLDPA